jgi:hypothetical protein
MSGGLFAILANTILLTEACYIPDLVCKWRKDLIRSKTVSCSICCMLILSDLKAARCSF